MEVFLEVACVTGVKRGRRRGNLGACESVWTREKGKERSSPPPSFLARGLAT